MADQTGKRQVLLIRTWPKMIFLWPTAIFALLAGLGSQFFPSWNEFLGHSFVICLLLNLTVLTFDFPRSTSLTVFVSLVTLLLVVILINQRFGIIGPVKDWIEGLEIQASRDFYFAVFIGMLVLYGAMAVVTRFDYWELTSNELVHHTGLLGDVERFSTAGLKLNTELNDVFEYLLAGAGRIILDIPGQSRPVVLDNVLQINKVMLVSKDLLSRRVVEVAEPSRSSKTDLSPGSKGEYE